MGRLEWPVSRLGFAEQERIRVMRHVAAGMMLVVIVAFTLVAWFTQNPLSAQQPPAVKPLVLSDGLIALSSDTADGRQQVTVIDSKTRVMSVYHVEHTTGVISLKSVRDISADLKMDEFNTESPLPREIRAILKR
jgi:hypothetical protein